jgi:hypothetical protein
MASAAPEAGPPPRDDAGTGSNDDASAADASAGLGDASTEASTIAAPYKGVALSESAGFFPGGGPGNVPGGGTCSDVTTLDLAWYANGGVTTSCQTNAEFVPQIWGHPWEPIANEIASIVAAGKSTVLGFNEPDNAGGSNMSVTQAVASWPSLLSPSLRVGSPATSASQAGQSWMSQFMGQASSQNLRVDFIALHWIGPSPSACNDTSALESYIRWAEQWQRPIWLTSWGCPPQPGTTATSRVQSFFDNALQMFKNHPLLERYAWYLTRSNDDTALISATTGTLTALGTDYQAAPPTR